MRLFVRIIMIVILFACIFSGVVFAKETLQHLKKTLSELKEKEAKQKERVEELQEKFERLKKETASAEEPLNKLLSKDQNAFRDEFIKKYGDPSEWTEEENKAYQERLYKLNEMSKAAWEKEHQAQSEKLKELGKTIKELPKEELALQALRGTIILTEKKIAREEAELIETKKSTPIDEDQRNAAKTEPLKKEDEVGTLVPIEREDVAKKPKEATKMRTGPSYVNDFEGKVGSEWSKTFTAKTPRGNRRFLGRFGNETVTLTLNAPNGGSISLAFDLYLVDSWDGNNKDYGPDRWKLSVNGGTILLDTTFSNLDEYKWNQSYPSAFGKGDHPPGTGAAEYDSLGYSDYGDSVYHLTFTFQHGGGDVVIAFSGERLQGIGDESWGLDNIEVQGAGVIQDTKPPIEKKTERNLQDECMSVFKEFQAETDKRYKLIYHEKEGILKNNQKVVDAFNEIFKGDYITAKGMKTKDELGTVDKAILLTEKVWLSLLVGIAIGGEEYVDPEPVDFMDKKIVPGSIVVKKFDEEGYKGKTEPVYDDIWDATHTIEKTIIELRNKHAEFKVRSQVCGKEEAEKDYKESLEILLNMQNALGKYTKAIVEFREHTLSFTGILTQAYLDYTYRQIDPKVLEEDIKRATINCENSYNKMKAALKEFNGFFVDYQIHLYHHQDICKQCKSNT